MRSGWVLQVLSRQKMYGCMVVTTCPQEVQLEAGQEGDTGKRVTLTAEKVL